MYVSRLHTKSKKFKNYNNETIDLSNNSRGIVIYDKTTEVRKKSKLTHVPENLLRLEARLNADYIFEKEFGKKHITVNDLLFQLDKLPDILYKEYLKIDKEYEMKINKIESKQDLIDYAIVQTGFDNCKILIDNSYNLGSIAKQNRDRYFKSVKLAYKNQEKYVTEDDLIKELDEKVLDWYNLIKNNY